MLFTRSGWINFATLMLRKYVRDSVAIFAREIPRDASRRRANAPHQGEPDKKSTRLARVFVGKILRTVGRSAARGASCRCAHAPTQRITVPGPTRCGKNSRFPLPSAARDRGCRAPAIYWTDTWCGSGSTHLPCSRIRAMRRASASAWGMLYWTQFLPT